MKLEQAMMLLQGLTTREIRDFMRTRLPARDAESFDVLIENVSHDVLLLVSARALTRLGVLPATSIGRDGAERREPPATDASTRRRPTTTAVRPGSR